MSATTDPRNSIQHSWALGESGWDTGMNANLKFIDNFGIHLSVKDRDLATPPGSPTNGDTYIIASSPTGAWSGKALGTLAMWSSTDNAWRFQTPRKGYIAYIEDEAIVCVYSTSWSSVGGTIGKHGIPVMAIAMTPRVTGGCAALTYYSAGTNYPDVPYLAFDPSSVEYAEFSILMPPSWNEGTVTFVPVWMHPATTTNFGVVWSLQAVAIENGDAFTAVAFGTAQTSADTGGSTLVAYFGPESSAITIAGVPTTGCMVHFRIARETGNGSDNMAVDAYLLGLMMYITTSAETDA